MSIELVEYEKMFIHLFEENGYVESYDRKSYDHKSYDHDSLNVQRHKNNMYFFKNMYLSKDESGKINKGIDCEIKYSYVFDYISFNIYVSSYEDEYAIIGLINLEEDDIVYPDKLLRMKYVHIDKIKNMLAMCERMYEFIRFCFDRSCKIINSMDYSGFGFSCNKCNNQIFKIDSITNVIVFDSPSTIYKRRYSINDDFASILDIHACIK
jgi:hypothetical protein